MDYAEVAIMTRTGKISLYIVFTILSLACLLPMYAMINTSFKDHREVAQREFLNPPRAPRLENYVQAFNVLRIGLQNSFFVATIATLLSILLGSWSGYFLSMFRFKYSQLVFFLTSIATFLPYQIMLIPFTQFMARLHLVNTHAGLVVAYVILNTPMAALITATFFQAIPVELQEAAALDGCGPINFYFRILIPVSLLGLVSATLLTFTMIWNEFLIALTLTQGPFVQMATPVLAGMKGNYAALWHIQMAGSLLTSLPPLLIFILLGRYYVKGLMAGTLKG
jgi:glucose/mannose transport system permease protein